jgi:hypothetical protein
MRSYILTFILILLSVSLLNAQSVRVNGKLIDKDENKLISNGIIYLNPGNQVTSSDLNGAFTFNCTPGKKQLITRVLGYKSAYLRLELSSDTSITINLKVLPFELSEVKITGDSIKNMKLTPHGSIILTPAALRETPRIFSEPDLLKSFQMLPGVISGKDGSSEIFVRGGTVGQNIVLANGCYFFLPGHLLGFVSPYDLDFLESAELYKDYFPSDLGGGASSVISLNFKRAQSDSLRAQVRLGLLSSGITFELPIKKINWELTGGLKRGNYSLYAPLLKKIVSPEVRDNLPPDNYSFYDGFIRMSHSSLRWGNISYLFFGNYDKGKDEQKTRSQNSDTTINYTNGISTGWNNMVHALQWELPANSDFKWKVDLNFNRISMGRDIYMQTDKFLNENTLIESRKISYSFSPTIKGLGSTILMTHDDDKFSYSAGISTRLRYFSPNTIASDILNDVQVKNEFGESSRIIEPSAFFSSSIHLAEKMKFITGLRISSGITKDAKYYVIEPRLRLVYDEGNPLSPHINWIRLSQFDHSVEGSNAGLRSMLWLPISKAFGPEVSDVLSAGVQGQIENSYIWTVDGYYKKTTGMVDFKSGASFIFDNSIDDMLERINGRAYGLETGIIKRKGKLTGSASYTYSRSKREWDTPEGLIWIPASADRPHNFNVIMKYHFNKRMSFGLNWVYTSGSPATIYMHNTSYGEWFETKNNIRYFDYHRLDLSYRQIILKRRFTILLDVDVYNVYNRKNTFYLLQTYDSSSKSYYFKNVSLFPIMPSLTLTIGY